MSEEYKPPSRFKQRLTALGFKTYEEYLQSKHWKQFKDFYNRSGRIKTCIVCNIPKIQLHHHTYERLGAELPDDVTPLCNIHHEGVHDWLKKNEKMVNATHLAVAELKARHELVTRAIKSKKTQRPLTKRQRNRKNRTEKKERNALIEMNSAAAAIPMTVRLDSLKINTQARIEHTTELKKRRCRRVMPKSVAAGWPDIPESEQDRAEWCLNFVRDKMFWMTKHPKYNKHTAILEANDCRSLLLLYREILTTSRPPARPLPKLPSSMRLTKALRKALRKAGRL